MKRFILFFSAAVLGATLYAEDTKPQAAAPAESPAAPASSDVSAGSTTVPTDQSTTQPDQQPGSEQPASDQNISLIPESLPNSSKKGPSQKSEKSKVSDKKGKSGEKGKEKENFSADAVKKRIHMRQVKNQALQDEKLLAEMDVAQTAKTDDEKRAALKRYYNALCDRMLKIDPSLKEEVEARRADYLSRYDQHRVRTASEPLTEF